MNLRNIGIGIVAALVAFLIGFAVGMSIYCLEPSGFFLPGEVFAGAFPGLRAGLRNLVPVSSFEAA
jgi:hypothetical protein